MMRGVLSTASVLIFVTGSAMSADDKKSPSNTMGNILNNQGIVTQGQVGNNTINFGPPPPTLSVIGEAKVIMPSAPGGTGSYQLTVEIAKESRPQSLCVAVRRRPDMMGSRRMGPVMLYPTRGGVTAPSIGGNDEFATVSVDNPKGQWTVQVSLQNPQTAPEIHFSFDCD